MISSILLLFGALACWAMIWLVSGMRRNLALAKSSGLPYYLVPINPVNPFAQLLAPVWIAIWKLLVPRKYWENVADVCIPDWHYRRLHEPFEKLGDTFLLVTPTQLMGYTDNAEVIHQFTSKRESFPKPIFLYALLKLFGENVVTTEGAIWRMHRKVTSASFNEKNSGLVFHESVEQTQGMLSQWLQRGESHNIRSMEDDTMTWALNIIGYVGFGLRLLWPGQSLASDTDPRLAKYASLGVPKGHTLSFKDSIAATLHHLLLLVLTPTVILNYVPLKKLKSAKEARDNFESYMEEFLHDKVEDVRQGDKDIGMDIMGSLVATSYQDKQDKARGMKNTELKDSEIIGNAFIMFLAGHETTANVIHFTLLELANNPAVQRRLQKDIDTILGDADPSTWDYDANVNAMMASMLGACMNETLRLMPPVIEVPKSVTPNQDQPVTVDGKSYTMPRGTYMGLVSPAVQRNPRYWPAKPSRIREGKAHDLDDWVPERWFRPSMDVGSSTDGSSGGAEEDFGGYAGPDTSAQMFRPVRGSYIPFSDGARSCLGRRIAQVEIVAALAVIFQRYSLENAVDDFVADSGGDVDETIERMDREERARVYALATARSRKTLRDASSLVTLKLHGGAHVPVRLVPRRRERFVSWIDE
ncbi:cytochrome P450 [Xylariomycetidae sp. FL2044]|nr:cytochrome P450 [Xylariomycetidae sp. FL2044]